MGLYAMPYNNYYYLNGMNDFSEGQFSGESIAVINNGLSLFKVGHIQCCKKKNKIYHTD